MTSEIDFNFCLFYKTVKNRELICDYSINTVYFGR